MNMPTGIIINALSVLAGGIVGGLFGNRISDKFKNEINMIFGVASMTMGVIAIAPTKNMAPVIFALILGTSLGLIFHVGQLVNRGAGFMQRQIARVIPMKSSMPEDEFMATLLTVIVLFTATGTGIYGSLVNGMTGDATILISKSILDFFTATIFAANLGFVVSVIAVPQFIFFFILFLLAGFIYPLTNPAMITDFKAVGGVLMLATGFRMIKVKMFPTADMIPSMIIVMPLSWLWMTYILPVLTH